MRHGAVVATKDARTIPKTEESVLDMGRSAGNADMKDARTTPSKEVYVLGMGRRSKM